MAGAFYLIANALCEDMNTALGSCNLIFRIFEAARPQAGGMVATRVLRKLAFALASLALAGLSHAQTIDAPVLTFSTNPPTLELRSATDELLSGIDAVPHKLARRDRVGALLTQGGSFTVEGAGPRCAEVIASPDGFTFEIVAVVAGLDPDQSGSLVRVGAVGHSSLLDIKQTGASFEAILGSAGNDVVSVPIGVARSNTVVHLALVADSQRIGVYLDGVRTGDRPITGRSLAHDAQFRIGDNRMNARILQMTLHRAPLSDPAISARARHALEVAAQIPAAETLVVSAALAATSAVPTLEALAPYTQSLAVYEYTVQKVMSGHYDPKRLYVAHWTILDRVRLPFADRSPGGIYTLRLEPLSAQPQLASENLSDNIIEDFALPVYYDAGGTSLGFDVSTEAVAGVSPTATPSAAADPTVAFPAEQPRALTRQSRMAAIATMQTELDAQVSQLGGYPVWIKSLTTWRSDLQKLLKRGSFINIPRGKQDLSTRNGLTYLLEDSLQDAPPDGDGALDVILAYHQLLQSQGIDLLFVPVPPRDEVYADALSPACPPHRRVSPQMTQLLQALCAAGVEVVDLRGAFLDERQKSSEPLYTTLDIHWSAYGIRRAASEIAPRVRRYFTGENRVAYSEYQIRVVDQTNLAIKLSTIKESDVPAGEWDVLQVLQPNGSLYQDNDRSPVAVVGDSYTLRYREQAGNISARLAQAIGFPVYTIARNGGAPQSLQTLLDQDAKNHTQRRVIVWLVSAASLTDRLADNWKMPHQTP